MKRVWKAPRIVLTLLVVICSLSYMQTVLAADSPATVNIPAYTIVAGEVPKTNESFTLTLLAADGAPMPSGSVNGAKAVNVSGTGSATFGAVDYTEPGNYDYTVTEVKGSDGLYVYDGTIYDLTVQVTWQNEPGGALLAVPYITKQGGTAKEDRIIFTNQYSSNQYSDNQYFGSQYSGKNTGPISNPKTGDTSWDWRAMTGLAAIMIVCSLGCAHSPRKEWLKNKV